MYVPGYPLLFYSYEQVQTTLVYVERDPPLDENGRAGVHVQGMAPCMVPSATDDDSHLRHVGTTEETGRLVARSWHFVVEHELRLPKAWKISCNCFVYLPVYFQL
jgi:hypothetical protein